MCIFATLNCQMFEQRISYVWSSSASVNPFISLVTILDNPGGRVYGTYYSLPKLKDPRVDMLPYSIRILLESTIRNCDNFHVTTEDVESILSWETLRNKVEIPFKPACVLLEDFMGCAASVDLATMRDAMDYLGGDFNKINPLVHVDLVLDNPVQVQEDKEFDENSKRFAFLDWGSKAFRNMRVVPRGSGIVHQVVFSSDGMLYPDSVVGTGSHTTMINALGVVGWRVGGIGAVAAMLGQPMSMVLPAVVGFKLTNKLIHPVTATDLGLTISYYLRKHDVVGNIVEFYGDGVDTISLVDRATIASMWPKFGATMGFFPVDNVTLEYLMKTGRSKDTVFEDKSFYLRIVILMGVLVFCIYQVDMIKAYLRANNMFVDQNNMIAYSSTMEIDLSQVKPCVSGPKRPHDQVLRLKNMKLAWESCLGNQVGFKERDCVWDVPSSNLYPWDPNSTYIHKAPYFGNMKRDPPRAHGVRDAICLVNLGDNVKADHIFPADEIQKDSKARPFLLKGGVDPKHFESSGSQCGIDETKQLQVFNKALRHKNDSQDTIVLAGEQYGTGSSSDWAAEGLKLLGVKAVIAKSFERTYRSKLAGMGIIPLRFKDDQDANSLKLTCKDRYTISFTPTEFSKMRPGDVTVTTNTEKSFTCTAALRLRVVGSGGRADSGRIWWWWLPFTFWPEMADLGCWWPDTADIGGGI